MPDVDYLYETPETGMLQQGADGKAFRFKPDEMDTSRPSLSGPYTGPGAPRMPTAHGIGGTVVGAEKPATAGAGKPRPMAQRRQPSPAELMIGADLMEQSLAHQMRAAENPYGSAMGTYASKDDYSGPPDWLQQYMSTQPFTDPYHQEPVRGVDMSAGNDYLQERDKLRYLKQQAQK